MVYGLLRFGIIGCGLIANWHASAIKQVQGAELSGVADANKDASAAFAVKQGVKAFESTDDLLSDPDIDIVSICTPSGLHAPLAVQAANAGKHVVLEKPMAISLSEADDIIRVCEKNNVKLAVVSQLRFTPAVARLKAAVDQGLLGRLVTGDIIMKYYRSQEYYDKSGWRGTWKMDGGGALMNQGIHGIDLLRYVMGPVKSVAAYARTLARKIEVEDTAVAVVEFRNGALGIIQGTTSVYPGTSRRLEVSGDKGTIVLEEDSIVSWNIEGQETPGDIGPARSDYGAARDPAAFGIEGHTLQIRDMVEAVRMGRQPLVDQYQGRKPVQIILAIYESSRTGQPVELQDN